MSVAGLGGDLQDGLHQLGFDVAGGRGLEHRLDGVDELEGLGVEDHQLLLDPDRVCVSGEAVLHWPPSLRDRPEGGSAAVTGTAKSALD